MVSNKIFLAGCLTLLCHVVSGSGAARRAADRTIIVPPVLPSQHKTKRMQHPALLVRGGGRNNNDLHDNIKDDFDDSKKKATVIQVHGIICTILGLVYGLESMGWMTVPFLGPAAAFPGLSLLEAPTNKKNVPLQTMVRAMASFMIGTGLMEVQLSYEPVVQTVFLLYHVLLLSALVMGAIHQYSQHYGTTSTTITNAMLLTSLVTPLTTAGFGIAGFLF